MVRGRQPCAGLTATPLLRSKVSAVVAFYPVVDFVPGKDMKARSRPYKAALGGFRGQERDYLYNLIDTFEWAYLGPGQSRTDPLLSPTHTDFHDLPKYVFTVGCELDMFAMEALKFMCKLSGREMPAVGNIVGRQEIGSEGELVTEGDERFAWEEIMDDGEVYRWLLVPDVVHGFDQDIIQLFAWLWRDRAMLTDARIKRDKVIDIVGQWLLEGPFKAGQNRERTQI